MNMGRPGGELPKDGKIINFNAPGPVMLADRERTGQKLAPAKNAYQ